MDCDCGLAGVTAFGRELMVANQPRIFCGAEGEDEEIGNLLPAGREPECVAVPCGAEVPFLGAWVEVFIFGMAISVALRLSRGKDARSVGTEV